jgi:hypothetical protein
LAKKIPQLTNDREFKEFREFKEKLLEFLLNGELQWVGLISLFSYLPTINCL